MEHVLPPKTSFNAYIDGRHEEAADGATFETVDPSTGKVLGEVTAGGAEDIDRAVKAARRSFTSGVWSRLAPAERKRILLRFADLLEDDLEIIAQLDSVEAGKPITDCREIDTPDAINTIRWYAESIDKVFGKVSPTSSDNLAYVVREAIGVVGVVVPWNFPAVTLAWKIGPALAAGNSIVVKPAELSSLGAIRFAELATEAGVPDGVFNVVPGLGHIAGKALGLHDDVDAITFTGSTEVGRKFLRYAADSNLKEVSLECGGKSPQIVFADAKEDLQVIAEDMVTAAFWNAGQNCTAGSRILVQNSIRSELVELLVERANKLRLGSPADPGTQMGPLIEASAADRTIRYIEEAVSAGAEIAAGGKRALPETGGYFVQPTVLDGVTPDMPVAREEIFGPVVAVLGFEDTDEAIRIANASSYGLAATIWSRDIYTALKLAGAVRAGTVAINGYSEGDITTPFGGFRTSGFGGREKGIEAFEQYTELKTVWITLDR
ncbi:aldehyde dehydrogenase [Arthrobacter sp. CAU 1506]|uniref:aldehyde dehydrogenase n=1 Tax=Arthrobacter sp. CAU 1506 TaxID=2560052 RepID=UPI0010AD3296|nr:aldehyde dehydrogenase [Arthrobacter sp. CAU 1506]TJY67186.1 aldehyde dehydrogenase [Arthrobacter sp. CAU 1506]